jgi:uncharacterized protein with PQ loop repeat
MWVSVLLTIILLLPAVIDIFKTKNTVSISKWMYLIYPVCSISWVVYAILLIFEDVPWYEIVGIAICEFVSMLFAIYILYMKLKNIKSAKKMHMSEAEWFRWKTKEKLEHDKLKKLGIKTRHDLHELKNQRHKLIRVLKDLYKKNKNIVDERITKNKEYIKNTNHEIKSVKRRLDHFINISNNANLAQVIWLIYLDIYKSN